jgi:hypothetical protein
MTGRAGFCVLTSLVVLLSGPFPAFAASPPKAGCRPVSKLEYNIAKKENVTISQGGRYECGQGHSGGATFRHCPV